MYTIFTHLGSPSLDCELLESKNYVSYLYILIAQHLLNGLLNK